MTAGLVSYAVCMPQLSQLSLIWLVALVSLSVCGLTGTVKGDKIINKGLQIRFVSISCKINKMITSSCVIQEYTTSEDKGHVTE